MHFILLCYLMRDNFTHQEKNHVHCLVKSPNNHFFLKINLYRIFYSAINSREMKNIERASFDKFNFNSTAGPLDQEVIIHDTRKVKVLSLPETIKEKSTFRAKALRRELV